MKFRNKLLFIAGLVILFLMSFLAFSGYAQSFFGNSYSGEISETNQLPQGEVNQDQDNLAVGEKDEVLDEIINEEPNNEDPIEEAIPDVPQVKPPTGKTVYLTFDDGPTLLTEQVLGILNKYDVKATFFVIGKQLEKFPEIAKGAYEEGHMLLPHSYSHDYAIYSTFEAFYSDFYRAEEVFETVMGFQPPPIFRFPGGSSNQSSFKYGGEQFMPALTDDIKEKGYFYIDWNVSAEDTGVNAGNKEKLLGNVVGGLKGKDIAIVLFHDTAKNKAMVDILPNVIETLQNKGYEFKTFRDITQEELDKLVTVRLANKIIRR